MGWHTGPPSWTEMERVLNGKPRRAGWPLDEQVGDGGDRPARARKRGRSATLGGEGGGSEPLDVERPVSAVPYAELHAHSAYSFLDGASTPEELVEEAARLDLRGIALADPSVCACAVVRRVAGGGRDSWRLRIWPDVRKANCAKPMTR